MKIHEYQAKELFRNYKIETPFGKLTDNLEEAFQIGEELGYPCVIKAQVHSGARGKAGGIKLAKNSEEFKQYATQILGMELKSIQTGDESKTVHSILIEQGVNIDRELYISITTDRAKECITVIASTEGGMDIEAVAEETPELIFKEEIDIRYGMQAFNYRNLVTKLKLTGEAAKQFSTVLNGIYKLYVDKDCSLVEINPLVVTKENNLLAIDGKVNFDENALYRHADIMEYRDIREENPLEVEASKFNLNYIKLDGNIGCMVNGAGLAMATMDIVKLAGAAPANFLDVGGGASAEKIENAFKILISDKNVEGVFINIFGGILRCDVLAEGITNAVKSLNVDIPVIVRLEGTNCELGAEILQNSGLKFSVASDLNHAVELIQEILKVSV